MVKLKVEIADTPHLQQQGLMFRKHLPNDCGMLFKFSRPQRLSFWGLNTYIPLDIAFINKNNEICSIEKIKPMSMSMVSSRSSECPMAVEANEGFFNHHRIRPGDRVVEGDDCLVFINKENMNSI